MKLDRISFELGMINCFVEMVACGVKQLAISPPINPQDYKLISELSEKIVNGFGIKFCLEKSLILTDLQSAEFTKGKWSILYYEKDEVLQKYFQLKEKKQKLKALAKYNTLAKKDISRELMRLLSYPEEKIEEKLSQENPKDPFILSFDE